MADLIRKSDQNALPNLYGVIFRRKLAGYDPGMGGVVLPVRGDDERAVAERTAAGFPAVPCVPAPGGGERCADAVDTAGLAGIRGRAPERSERGRGTAVVGPHGQPDRRPPQDLCEMDPQAPSVSPGEPYGETQEPVRHGRARTRTGVDRSRTPKASDAADHLPVIGGRSRDRRRNKKAELPDERPRRKGYRPWRNRAIVYTLVETGMRRTEVTSIDLGGIDFERSTLLITEKGGQQRRCLISKEGMKSDPGLPRP